MTKFHIRDASVTAPEGKVSPLVGKLGYAWSCKEGTALEAGAATGQLWRLGLQRDSAGGWSCSRTVLEGSQAIPEAGVW